MDLIMSKRAAESREANHASVVSIFSPLESAVYKSGSPPQGDAERTEADRQTDTKSCLASLE